MEYLKQRKIPAQHDLEDLAEDIKNFKRMGEKWESYMNFLICISWNFSWSNTTVA